MLDDREHAGQRRAREQCRLERPAASTTSSPVSRSAATTRSGISRSANERAGVAWSMTASRPSFVEQVRAAAHDVPRPGDLPARETSVGAQRLPHGGELRDAGEVRRVTTAAPLSAPAEVPITTSGTMPRSSSAAQHADLADALVAATGEHERGARSSRARRIARAAVVHAARPWSASSAVAVPSVHYAITCGRQHGRACAQNSPADLGRMPRHGSPLEMGPRVYSARSHPEPGNGARV